MTKIKLEHIDNLTKGKKSGAKIGSRSTPHHLYQYEQFKYELALKKKYLNISQKDRVNLRNIWEKVCIAKNWDCIIFEKSFDNSIVNIFKNNELIFEWNLEDSKKFMKNIKLNN